MILGVAEWLSFKLGWDVSIIRIAFVIAFIFYGTGLGLYLILWLVKQFSN
ncbi:PspC domain-containing protein [Croceimicrobium sp.]|tara:strand:- start:381 stop:530 length:150 start_codon:yes stop_codon:yes gene_type:complete